MQDESPTDEQAMLNSPFILRLKMILFSTGIGLCGVILILNLCILLRILCSKRLRTPTNILLVNLTLADFLLGLAFLVPSVIHLLFVRSISANNIELFAWVHSMMRNNNSKVALAIYAPMATSMLVSMLTLTAMAVNKYIKIFHPYYFMRISTHMKKSCAVIVSVIWSVSILVCILPLLVFKNEPKCHFSAQMCEHIKLIICMFHSIFQADYLAVFTVICLTCSCVIFVMYARIYFMADHEFRFISQRSSLHSSNSAKLSSKAASMRKTSLPGSNECKMSVGSNESEPMHAILDQQHGWYTRES